MSANAHTELVDRAAALVGAVCDPELGVPLARLRMVRGVELADGVLTVRIALTVPGCPMKARIRQDVVSALANLPAIERVEVVFDSMSAAERGALVSDLSPSTRATRFAGGATRVIAVASGKGGVGKSTVTANLACALSAAGQRVGVIDADVWGFSMPRLLGVSGTPVGFNGMLLPLQAHGVKLVSVGFFVEGGTPIVWRGPMLHKAMEQFLDDVYWGDLDVLLCDLPPGTGDVPISLASMLPEAGVVVVTTPQEAAREVAERAGRMAEQAGLQTLGVIENMASFVCPCCGEETQIFGSGGGETLAEALGTQLLARIPLTLELREAGDRGTPLVVSDPGSPAGESFADVASRLIETFLERHPEPALARAGSEGSTP